MPGALGQLFLRARCSGGSREPLQEEERAGTSEADRCGFRVTWGRKHSSPSFTFSICGTEVPGSPPQKGRGDAACWYQGRGDPRSPVVKTTPGQISESPPLLPIKAIGFTVEYLQKKRKYIEEKEITRYPTNWRLQCFHVSSVTYIKFISC